MIQCVPHTVPASSQLQRVLTINRVLLEAQSLVTADRGEVIGLDVQTYVIHTEKQRAAQLRYDGRSKPAATVPRAGRDVAERGEYTCTPATLTSRAISNYYCICLAWIVFHYFGIALLVG